MSDVTSILDLPTDPVGGGNNGNISISAKETTHQPQQGGLTLDPATINQIVNGIQQANLSGATQLPSRDIPITSGNIVRDEQVLPNYVPPPPPNQTDYIRNNDSHIDIINDHNRRKNMNSSIDDLYNEIQTPLLLAVMYFLFQLPFFKKLLFSYLPFLFSNDGNYNINGYVMISILFGMAFHFLIKTTSYLSRI
jgi:hypothetical protein